MSNVFYLPITYVLLLCTSLLLKTKALNKHTHFIVFNNVLLKIDNYYGMEQMPIFVRI